jgi:hypothetical protein
MLLSSAVAVYLAAAAVLVVGADPGTLRVLWGLLAVASSVPALALIQAVRRSQAHPNAAT